MAEGGAVRKWLSWLYNSSVVMTSRMRPGLAIPRMPPPSVIYITGVGMGPNPCPGAGVARCIRAAAGSDSGNKVLTSSSDVQLVALDKWEAASSGMCVGGLLDAIYVAENLQCMHECGVPTVQLID